MTKISKTGAGEQATEGGVSRRMVLGAAAAIGVGAVCAGSQRAFAQQKQSQAEASYVEKAPGSEKCSGCALFAPPNACNAVDGNISPEGYCALYSPKA